MIAEMTAKEMRNTNETTAQMVECCELLRAEGWKWVVSSYTPADCSDVYNWGWWINEAHPTKNKPTGAAGGMLVKAWDTVKAYVKEV